MNGWQGQLIASQCHQERLRTPILERAASAKRAARNQWIKVVKTVILVVEWLREGARFGVALTEPIWRMVKSPRGLVCTQSSAAWRAWGQRLLAQ